MGLPAEMKNLVRPREVFAMKDIVPIPTANHAVTGIIGVAIVNPAILRMIMEIVSNVRAEKLLLKAGAMTIRAFRMTE